MNFLKNRKISSKLRIPIVLQLILLLAFVYFFFSIQSLLSTEKGLRTTLGDIAGRIQTFSFSMNDYLDRSNKNLEQLNTEYKGILKLLINNSFFKDKKRIQSFRTLEDEFKKSEALFKSNEVIETQINELTDLSIKQSDGYLKEVSRKLTNRSLRASVSDLERAVIAGATINTNSNFQVKVLFQQVKNNSQLGNSLTAFLDQLNQNVDVDIKRLAGTPFAQMAVKAKEANIKIKQLATTFLENMKSLNQLKLDIKSIFDSTYHYITRVDSSSTKNVYESIKFVFYKLFGVILLITMLIMILSMTLTRWIVSPLNAMMERAYDLAVDDVDLTRRLAVDSKDETGELANWFNKFLERLHQLIIKVKSGSSKMHLVTEDIRQSTDELASRTNQQAAAITETSTTLEQFTSAIRENTENSAEADMMLVEFNSEIQEKSTLIDNVTHTMTEIFDSSKQIDNIIKVINDISFQTNLLALNAAVEAARAGEAGRGFAVVASEVRNLAQKTAESSKTIQEIVIRNVESTQKGMALVKDTSAFFGEIVGVMGDIVTKISNITTASREQALGMEQINQTIAQMDQVSSQNAQLVQQLSTSGRGVEGNAIELQELVTQFKVDGESNIKGSDYFSEVGGKKEKKSDTRIAKKKEEKKADQKKTKPVIKESVKAKNKGTGNSPTEQASSAPTEDDFFGNDEDGFEEF
jgi:methyl-accepting chemotaxis protein